MTPEGYSQRLALCRVKEEEEARPHVLGSEVRRASLLKEAPRDCGAESVKRRGQMQRALQVI